VAWHVHIAILVISILCGWRPDRRVTAVLISIPLASEAALTLVTANPFTTAVPGGTLVGIQKEGRAKAADRLDLLHTHGPTLAAFTFRHAFDSRGMAAQLRAARAGGV